MSAAFNRSRARCHESDDWLGGETGAETADALELAGPAKVGACSNKSVAAAQTRCESRTFRDASATDMVGDAEDCGGASDEDGEPEREGA